MKQERFVEALSLAWSFHEGTAKAVVGRFLSMSGIGGRRKDEFQEVRKCSSTTLFAFRTLQFSVCFTLNLSKSKLTLYILRIFTEAEGLHTDRVLVHVRLRNCTNRLRICMFTLRTYTQTKELHTSCELHQHRIYHMG